MAHSFEGKVLSPSTLAHVVLKTNQLERMTKFYCRFLGGRVVYANEYLAFITYDHEHHRIALAQFPGTTDKDQQSCGLAHIAFTFPNVKDLCTAYKQRKALGMEPGWCVVSIVILPQRTAN
jgi:catechol-2,3-dioxygenase